MVFSAWRAVSFDIWPGLLPRSAIDDELQAEDRGKCCAGVRAVWTQGVV